MGECSAPAAEARHRSQGRTSSLASRSKCGSGAQTQRRGSSSSVPVLQNFHCLLTGTSVVSSTPSLVGQKSSEEYSTVRRDTTREPFDVQSMAFAIYDAPSNAVGTAGRWPCWPTSSPCCSLLPLNFAKIQHLCISHHRLCKPHQLQVLGFEIRFCPNSSHLPQNKFQSSDGGGGGHTAHSFGC